MTALLMVGGGVLAICALMGFVEWLSNRHAVSTRFDDGMLQQMLGDAKAEGYCEGDRHGYARGLADGVRREREDAEWRANAIQQLIDTTKGRP